MHRGALQAEGCVDVIRADLRMARRQMEHLQIYPQTQQPPLFGHPQEAARLRQELAARDAELAAVKESEALAYTQHAAKLASLQKAMNEYVRRPAGGREEGEWRRTDGLSAARRSLFKVDQNS